MSEKFTLKDIVSEVAEETGAKKGESELILKSAFAIIERIVSRGEDVRIHDFGTFKLKSRPERVGRNPITGEQLLIPAKSVVTFQAVKRGK